MKSGTSVFVFLVAGSIFLMLNSCNHRQTSMNKLNDESGIIYADSAKVASNLTMEKYQAIVSYFNNPLNKVRMQFPGDESRFAWQNMSLFFPTAQVPRSGSISMLPYNIQKSVGSMTYRNSKGETFSVDEHFEKFPVDGMIVVKNGAIVYERYKTMRPDDKHIWYSVSKVIGSTLMLFLEEQGKVNVNNPVTDYLPELKGTEWDQVKVVEALDMATGLNGTEFDEPEGGSTTNPEQIWYQWAVSVGILPGTAKDTAKWYEVLGKMKRVRPAYDVFAYNSISTFVVDRIVERVGNKPLTVQLSEYVWQKMGMEHDGYMVVSPEGYCLGNGFMNSTLRDLARFGLIYTPAHVKICNDTIIKDHMLKKMQSTEHADMYPRGSVGKFYQAIFPDQKRIANRYQWDVVFEDGDLFKSGIGGQGLYVSPSKNIVVAWFCTGPGSDQEEAMARSIVNGLK